MRLPLKSSPFFLSTYHHGYNPPVKLSDQPLFLSFVYDSCCILDMFDLLATYLFGRRRRSRLMVYPRLLLGIFRKVLHG